MASDGRDGVELRDFAVEGQTDGQKSVVVLDAQPATWPTGRFWSDHVRITIEEAASRDHLGRRI